MHVPIPSDPRLAPIERLRAILPFAEDDTEARQERRLLHRADLNKAVRG